MQARDFAFWLQGLFELSVGASNPEVQGFTAAQATIIKNHLNLVFRHEIDPAMGNEEHQKALNAVHGAHDDRPKLRC